MFATLIVRVTFFLNREIREFNVSRKFHVVRYVRVIKKVYFVR